MKKIVMKALIVALLCSGSVSAGFFGTLTDKCGEITKKIQGHVDTLNATDFNVQNLKESLATVQEHVAEGTKTAAKKARTVLKDMSKTLDDMRENSKHPSEDAKIEAVDAQVPVLSDAIKRNFLCKVRGQ